MEEAKPVTGPKGWWWPSNAGKAHYFDNDRTSLCGRWAYMGRSFRDFEDDLHDSKDNCVVCKRKREALANATATQA